jgi:uncharacterized protein YecT (DUF1311 family)
MSRWGRLTILSAAALALAAACATADPLLTKAQIAKAADKIGACLDKQASANKPNIASCQGLIKGPCDDAIEAGGEAAHATCSDNETAAWDVLLNRRWSELASTLEPDKFSALKVVQKLWLSYRDAKCKFVEGDGSDMMAYMEAADCRLDETTRRTLELRAIE